MKLYDLLGKVFTMAAGAVVGYVVGGPIALLTGGVIGLGIGFAASYLLNSVILNASSK